METSAVHARPELLQVAETVARDKNIDREEVLEAMEQAIQKAGRSKYGHEYDIRVHIDRTSGEISLARYLEVVDHIENEAVQLTLEKARRLKPDAKIGDFVVDPLPPIDFGRIAAQTAKQVIVQKVREAERRRQYEEFKNRIGEIVNGVVKRVEFGNVIVDLQRAEALLRREECIPREHFNTGDRVRSYIVDVREEPRGPQVFLSRTHPRFMAKLFAQEVPEIYEGIIEIRAVARDPGSRAKIAVYSRDSGIDPVGPCIGMRGSRVQAVVAELQGEKIDIIQWSNDPATFIVNALAPAEVAKVVLDEEARRIEVVVPDDQLSLAIGRRGQNVRLASQLTGWDIDILTEEEESNRRTEEFRTRSQTFIDALNIDDVICWSRKAFLRWRTWRSCRWTSSPASKALTRRSPRHWVTGREPFLPPATRNSKRSASSSGLATNWRKSLASNLPSWLLWVSTESRPSMISPIFPATSCWSWHRRAP